MSFNPLHLLSLSLLRSSIPKQWAYSEWESLELGHLHGFLAFGYDCVFQACIFHIDNLELAILSGSPGSFSGELGIRNYNLKKKKKKLQPEDRGAYYYSLLFVDLPIGWNWYMCVCVCVCVCVCACVRTYTFKIKACLS